MNKTPVKPPNPVKRWRSFSQLSLQTMLLLFFLLSVWLAYNVWRHNRDATAVEIILERCEEVTVKWQDPWWLAWAGDRVGKSIFTRVVHLRITDETITDAELRALPIGNIGRLDFVEIACPYVSDETARELSGLPNVFEVHVVVAPEELRDDDTQMIPRKFHGHAA